MTITVTSRKAAEMEAMKIFKQRRQRLSVPAYQAVLNGDMFEGTGNALSIIGTHGKRIP